MNLGDRHLEQVGRKGGKGRRCAALQLCTPVFVCRELLCPAGSFYGVLHDSGHVVYLGGRLHGGSNMSHTERGLVP